MRHNCAQSAWKRSRLRNGPEYGMNAFLTRLHAGIQGSEVRSDRSEYSVRESRMGDSLPSKSESSKVNHFRQEKWAKMPASVLKDRRLSANDISVFGMIVIDRSYKRSGAPKPVSVGTRKIAQALGMSQATVSRAVKHLVECGHLRKRYAKRGARGVYEFASDVFLHVERRKDGVILVTGYSGVPKHAGVVPEPTQPVRVPKARTA